MGINIIETPFKWNGKLKMTNKPHTIILHHAESKNCTVLDIDAWHKARAFIGIGYQYFVRKNGAIYRGRPELAEGAHCIPYNGNSIAICAEGSYQVETMPEVQKAAIIALEKDIFTRHKITNIYGHGEVWATACPGRNYPLRAIKEAAYSNAVAAAPATPAPAATNTPTASGVTPKEAVMTLQRLCNTLGARDKYGNALDIDGKGGEMTRSAVEKLPICGKAHKTPTATIYLQTQLKAWGHYYGVIDGVFWTLSELAVKSLQAHNGLQIDGVVGKATWLKILELAIKF